jgi:hypothetical protein
MALAMLLKMPMLVSFTSRALMARRRCNVGEDRAFQ